MWKAEFFDGSVLNEYDEKGREVLFREVLERTNELKALSIVMGSKVFTVRLKDGMFTTSINGEKNHFYALDPIKYKCENLKNIRPIYFVRETVDLKVGIVSSGAGTPARVNFVALGFQANYNDKNIKKYLAIFPNGNFIIQDK